MEHLKPVLIAGLAALLAAPACAERVPDTLSAVTTRGIVMTVGGQSFAIAYAPDGTFRGVEHPDFSGAWKIRGDALCVSSPGLIEEACTAFPKGKQSGDRFVVELPMGPTEVVIR